MFVDQNNPHSVTREKIIFLNQSKYPSIFCSSYWSSTVVVNAEAKAWLEKRVSAWINFSALAVVFDPSAAQRLTDQRNYYESIGPHLSSEEYRARILDFCRNNSHEIAPGFYRESNTVGRYCVICTDVHPAKLNSRSYDTYETLEDYVKYRQRISSNPEKVLSTFMIYDLETGNQLKYLGNQKFTSISDK
jgi:hypothetical protein